jgi:hypothetical protein
LRRLAYPTAAITLSSIAIARAGLQSYFAMQNVLRLGEEAQRYVAAFVFSLVKKTKLGRYPVSTRP